MSDKTGKNPPKSPLPKGKRKICRPWVTKDGVRIYARNFGKKAFCFYVDA